jgi:starch synthase
MRAAIYFSSEGYVMDSPKLMGRQAAGHGFLRAAVSGRGQEPVWAYANNRASAAPFADLVKSMDSSAKALWCPPDRLDILAQIGCLYLPGPGLGAAANLRLRASPGAYSLCGVTHTTASHAAMASLTELLTAPVMPWDAVVCTSTAVHQTVSELLSQQMDFLRWRFGAPSKPWTLPQLPVIPLGVHSLDYQITATEKLQARASLGIAPDAVVFLFVGRLSFHAKAHPHAMFKGLQQVAHKTKQAVVLLQSGWYANQSIKAAFDTGAQLACPDVSCVHTDGRDPKLLRQSWAAADVFISLSDNIQETFGLTPVEAMAAGLPVVVSDWDGYKDTVRDGFDGFRIPTFMPGKVHGNALIKAYESGEINYDMYCGLNAQVVSVDMHILVEKLSLLAQDAALRTRMGEAARTRAYEVFDWSVVYGQYQTLWTDLTKMRQAATDNPDWLNVLRQAPPEAAAWSNPMQAFGHYPTHTVDAKTWVSPVDGVQPEVDVALWFSHGLYSATAARWVTPADATNLLQRLTYPMEVQTLAEQAGMSLSAAELAVSALAKMNLLRLRVA